MRFRCFSLAFSLGLCSLSCRSASSSSYFKSWIFLGVGRWGSRGRHAALAERQAQEPSDNQDPWPGTGGSRLRDSAAGVCKFRGVKTKARPSSSRRKVSLLKSSPISLCSAHFSSASSRPPPVLLLPLHVGSLRTHTHNYKTHTLSVILKSKKLYKPKLGGKLP